MRSVWYINLHGQKLAILFLSYLLSAPFVFSQDSKSDRIDSLLRSAQIVYETNVDSAEAISKRAYDLAVELKDTTRIARTIIHRASYLLAMQKLDEADNLSQFNLDNKDKLSQGIMGATYNNLGAIYSILQQHDTALNFYFDAIAAYESDSDIKGLARVHLNIGMIYNQLEKKEFSDYFFGKSKEYSAMTEGNFVHDLSAGDNIESEESQLAMSLEALENIEDEDNSTLAGMIYHGMSRIYLDMELYEEAIEAAQRSIEIKRNVNAVGAMALTYYYMGYSQLQLGRTNQGIASLNKALEISPGKDVKATVYETLIEEYRSRGNYKEAFETTKVLSVLKDSINLLRENDRIAEITAQFETEKQAAEIEILETDNELKATKIANQRNILWATALGIVLLLAALWFGYKSFRARKDLQLSELTRKLLQMQLNPHFLFNALNGIQFFIKKNDVKQSTRYINNFSGLMRNILENSVEKFISVEEDHATISDFLALQQLVNNNSFDYSIEVDENLDKENMAIPPMFTQPFVENAIIHGVRQVENGKIEVNYGVKDESILVRIRDNGKGIKPKKQDANSLHKSLGTSITKQRMENLLKSEKYPIELEIISRNEESGEQGTEIVLSFPLKYI